MANKTKVVRLTVKPTKEVLKRFATTLGRLRKGQRVKTHVGISFESVEGLRNVLAILTKRRLELLSIVRHKKPQSVYELSKLLNRDLKSVNTDFKVLKEKDFIGFKKVDEKRKRIVPVVEFDKIDIQVKV